MSRAYAPFVCFGCPSGCLHGTVRSASCLLVLCKLHTIEDHVLCHATVMSSTNIIKADESRRLHVLLHWRACSMYTQSLRYVLDNTVTRNTSRRTAAGRLKALCTYLQPWRGTARGLRSFRTCTTTRMQLEDRNVPCKQYCAGGLQQYLIYQYRGRDCWTTHGAKATYICLLLTRLQLFHQPPERVLTD